jgi:hypothetical protein
LGVQAHHAHRPAGQLVGGGADGTVGDGADLAQVLGDDDQLRVQLGQQVDVQVVDGQRGPEAGPGRRRGRKRSRWPTAAATPPASSTSGSWVELPCASLAPLVGQADAAWAILPSSDRGR